MSIDPAPQSGERSGTLIAIVGPSGAGKDMLITGARDWLPAGRFVFPRRIITRQADATEASESVSREEFESRTAAGDFALAWEANGLCYALPRAIHADLAAGRHVIVNLSRAVIAEARQRFSRMLVVHVTARRDIIEARMMARAREDFATQQQRIERGAMLDEGFEAHIRIENNGAPELALDALVNALAGLGADPEPASP